MAEEAKGEETVTNNTDTLDVVEEKDKAIQTTNIDLSLLPDFTEKTKRRIYELGRIYKEKGISLTSDGWNNPCNNPHVWPQLVGNDHQRYRDYLSECNIPFKRTIEPSDPTQSYRRRKEEEKSVLHWGQRKLLVAEIEFLTEYGHLSDTVVYAGAAPGTHIKLLSEMFSNHRFYLYDPAPFTVRNSRNIETHQIMFTDDVAASWAGKGVLFISDIRSADSALMEEDEVEENVQKDMKAQETWCNLMKPKMSSLKFRLPWSEGASSYFAGTIYYQAWGPITTTETRLFTDCKEVVKYDNRLYESQLFYFNTKTRIALYEHPIKDVPGLDHCYDCKAEVQILLDFFSKVGYAKEGKITDDQKLYERVADFIGKISNDISRDRTLSSGNEENSLAFKTAKIS